MKEIRIEIYHGSLLLMGFAEFNRHLHKLFTEAGVPVEPMEFSDLEASELTQIRWIQALRKAGGLELRTLRETDKDIIILRHG